MSEYLFRLPANLSGTLQSQIQQMMVDAILNGHIPPHSALPSGRKLALQLKVSRNTVVLAYQNLLDEGFIEARERSGFYVSGDVMAGYVQNAALLNYAHKKSPLKKSSDKPPQSDWSNKLTLKPQALPYLQKPKNWQKYPYPFVYGQFDKKLFPIADWRECCREASGIAAIHYWASDHIDKDNDDLLDQVHSKLLPRRGIWADKEEILITVGAQNALYIAAQLLLDKSKTIGMENPGYVDARNIFLTQTQNIQLLDIDDEGLIVDDKITACDCIYVTPSHQFPTTVTMSKARRMGLLEKAAQQDTIIIEDDYESELNYGLSPIPALKSLDKAGRVIYVGSLSKTLAPGLRLGYMVASREFIQQARAMRRIILRHPPSNNQFIIAQFLKRGYHDSLIRRLSYTLNHRSKTMKAMLDEHFPDASQKPDFGGSSYWVRGPEDLDAIEFASLAKQHGIIIEPGNSFFYPGTQLPNYFRLGFSSISAESIKVGLPLLRGLLPN